MTAGPGARRRAAPRGEAAVADPGADPRGSGVGSREDARANADAFVAEVGLAAPAVEVDDCHHRRGSWWWTFVLSRGIRHVVLEVPGGELSDVRYEAGRDPRSYPRLRVDGAPWLWEPAVRAARRGLGDPDGSRQRRLEEQEAACAAELAARPLCPACGAVRERACSEERGYRIWCCGCEPRHAERREDLRGRVLVGDEWRHRAHVLVHEQRVPAEAPGPRCRREVQVGQMSHPCRRAPSHRGSCEPIWRIVDRTVVDSTVVDPTDPTDPAGGRS